MGKDYKGLTFEQLGRHASEGWDLATDRTKQLRQAVEALRGAAHVIECWGRRLEEKPEGNVNLIEMFKVLEWGGRMFPEPGTSHHDVDEPGAPESLMGPSLPPGESMHDLP